jgi:hypothetical protein
METDGLDHSDEEFAVAVHHALIQGCDDGTYFEIQDDGLVIHGRINLLIVARALKARLVTPETVKH